MIEDMEIVKTINRHTAIRSEVEHKLDVFRDSEEESGDKIYGTLAERVACACEDIVEIHRGNWHLYTDAERKVGTSEIRSARNLFKSIVPEGYISGWLGTVITEIAP